MKNNVFNQYLRSFAYSLFFTGAMSALIWITVTYGSFAAVPVAAALCAGLYTCLALLSVVNLLRGNKLFSGASADVLSVSTQKRIRVGGVLVALPALLYCAIFAMQVKAFQLSGDAEALEKFGAFERSVFGKSVVCDVAGHEHECSLPAYEPTPVTVEEVAPPPESNRDVDFGPYMTNLQRQIKRAWYPPRKVETSRSTVIFKVHANGTMSNLRLFQSSGIALIDQAALKAVQNAAPFHALPEGAPPDVDIQFTFDYNNFYNPSSSLHDNFYSEGASSGDAFYSEGSYENTGTQTESVEPASY
ncbi:TonB C-terminal domain-containing protein [Candidatus Obscuribacterales bacterium]|nr:TonB C-terminal domain-containing protein [Candidatus Obscuribacterales bacterium]